MTNHETQTEYDLEIGYTSAHYYAMCTTSEERKDFNEQMNIDKAHFKFELRELDRAMGGNAVFYILHQIEMANDELKFLAY